MNYVICEIFPTKMDKAYSMNFKVLNNKNPPMVLIFLPQITECDYET